MTLFIEGLPASVWGQYFKFRGHFFDKKKVSWPDGGIQLLKEMGFQTAAMALTDDSVSIDDKNLMAEEKLAIVFGTEGRRVGKTTIATL